MKRLWALAAGLAAVLLLAPLAAGGDKQPEKKRRPGALIGRIAQGGPLLPKDAEAKLKLTDKQKEQVAKLQKEFDEKSAKVGDAMRKELPKVVEGVQKARDDKDIQALLPVGAELFQQVQEVRALREEYQDKVRDLLTAEQKKTFDEIRKEMGRRFDLRLRPREDRPPEKKDK